MKSRRTDDPAIEPVTVDRLKSHLRILDNAASAEDDTLELLIKAAREHVELETRRALIGQQWTLAFDRLDEIFPSDPWWSGSRQSAIRDIRGKHRYIELPIGPLMQIETVKYYGSDDSATIWPISKYRADTLSMPGRLYLRNGASWPSWTRDHDGLKIIYQAGYGGHPKNVPADLRQAIMIIAADWYENRESFVTGTISTIVKNNLNVILEKYRVHRL